MQSVASRDAMDLLPPGTNAGAARRRLADAFRSAGLDSPELDARVLTAHALNLDHAGLASAAERRLEDRERQTIEALAVRRLDREPVSRIVGCKEFWGLPFSLSPETLVPRPETETLVEAALAIVASMGRPPNLRIADLGTGSGALLVALLTELPEAIGVGTDVNCDALMTARENARRAGVLDRAVFTLSDFGAALGGPFDLVLSNPPYVKSGDISGLAPEVRFDPRRALDGGADGLDCYRTIVRQCSRLLKPGGWLVVEIGIGQGPAVASLCLEAGFAPEPALCDLAGLPRVVKAVSPA
jgi:release factor glutamine methyltransferase